MSGRYSLRCSRVVFAFIVATWAAPGALGDGDDFSIPPGLGTPSITIEDGSGYIAAGTGMNSGSGTIQFDIPTDAIVKQVVVYWAGFFVPEGPGQHEEPHDDPGEPAIELRGLVISPPTYEDVGDQLNDDTLTINGINVQGTLIGGPTRFYQNVYVNSYRADVTTLNIVGPGPNLLVLQDLAFSVTTDGAAVLVIYERGNQAADIVVRDGNDLAYIDFNPPLDTTVPQTMTFAPDVAVRDAALTLFVADVEQCRPNIVRVTIDGLSTDYVDLMGSLDGPEWDTLQLPIEVPAGATSLTVAVGSGAERACKPASLAWVAVALSVPSVDRADCDEDGVPDVCELDCAALDGGCAVYFPGECGGELDCNSNGVPDSCDVAAGTSYDCNVNGIPDECEPGGGACDDGDLCTGPDFCSNGVCSGPPIDCSHLDGVCQVGVCVPATGACAAEPAFGGEPCDDGDLCTEADVCSTGTCRGAAVDCTNLDDECLVGVCEPATGNCIAEPVSDGTNCTDGDLCTLSDACSNGVCRGQPVDCSYLDEQCIAGECDTLTGDCIERPADDGEGCDDGDLCTLDDVCTNGVCAGWPVDCSDLDDVCNVGRCNAATGDCYAAPVNDGGSCNDGDPCTVDDACTNGACSGVEMDCSYLDSACTRGVCDPVLAGCVAEPINDGLTCDDGDLCTEEDICSNGSCAGNAIDCSYLDDQCNLGLCVATTGLCEIRPAHEGETCDDGDLCTMTDVCSNGACHGVAQDCSYLNGPCTIGVCNDLSGNCEALPANEGVSCDDSDGCTVDDVCVSGQCSGAPKDCSALDDSCNVGECVGTSGVCKAQPANDGGPCDDSNGCTVDDFCSNGACIGSPMDCSHLDDQCLVGVCVGTTGVCAALPANDGGMCDDGNLCTINDLCTNGACAGTPVDCSHLDSDCLMGVCNSATGGCEAAPANEGAVCDDGNGCTIGDACSTGFCLGVPKDCSAFGDQCNIGVCVGTSGVCQALPANEGATCDDDDGCTIDDMCSNGACAGAPKDCSYLDDQCLLGTCIGTTGVCDVIPADEGGACDDDDLCTINDTCTNGACVGKPIDCSYLDGACLIGVCDPATGGCEAVPANEGGVCDDGNACTVDDVCSTGVCLGEKKDCSVFDDQCNIGVCIGTTGICAAQPAFEGNPCSDDNGCTVGDACTSGLCLGVAKDCSALDDQCNLGICVGTSGLCVAEPANESSSCTDGNGCTVDDVCSTGHCIGDAKDCSALDDQCNVGVCVGTTGLCEAQPDNEGGACADGDGCTVNETCTNGVCVGLPKDCSAWGDQCNVGVCIGTTGVCAAQPAFEGDACDDGSACTIGDVCTSGVCAGTPKDCSGFSDACNSGVCIGTTGVCAAQPTNEGGGCDDSDGCTINDVCSTGVCLGGAKDCSALDDACNIGVCVGTTGICAAQPMNEDGACDDGNGCTVNDVCSTGVCLGNSMDCSIFDGQCNIGVCIGTTGVCEAQPANEGNTCDDGDDCTVDDVCSNGGCLGVPKDCSGMDDQCNLGVCVGTSGVCQALPDREGLMCDDRNACTRADHCEVGRCVSEPIDCSFMSDQCNVGACVGTSGVCAAEPANEGATCDDGDLCTILDICSNGGCFGTPMLCPPGEVCDPQFGVCVYNGILRTNASQKGSLLIFSKVELRWDSAGNLTQDTFISLSNDHTDDVQVQMYFVNGDPPIEADIALGERAHPGWNWVDNQIDLTGNEPTYWSVASGFPKGVTPFTVLDEHQPGQLPGRPDPWRPGERMLRGFILAWAVNVNGEEIRWNHLAGSGVLVNYLMGDAWEYHAWSFGALDGPNPLDPIQNGQSTGTPGELHLDGVEFSNVYGQLLLDFFAVDSAALSGGGKTVIANTDLTLMPAQVDVRQESEGPATTKAHFDIWDMNEFKKSGTYRCVTCWDQALLSQYGVPNNFFIENLWTDKGKARIDGLASQYCDVDYDPSDGSLGTDPRDVISRPAGLLGVAAKHLTFGGDEDFAMGGGNLIGLGSQSGLIRADVIPSPPPQLLSAPAPAFGPAPAAGKAER